MKKRLYACALATVLFASSGTALSAPPPAAAETAALTDTSTALPEGSFSDLVVDDVHRQVFISMKSPDVVLVADFDGTITATITGFTDPWDLAIDDDGSTVYLVQGHPYNGYGTLGIIDTASLAVSHVPMPANHCPEGITFTGGKVWYSYLLCDGVYEGSLGAYDPATGAFAGDGVIHGEAGEITALPGRPDRVLQLDEWTTGGLSHVFDVSAGTPVELARGGTPFCTDAALIAGGEQVVDGCSRGAHTVRNTADLSPATPIDVGEAVRAVASTYDGRYLAATVNDAEQGRDAVVVLDVEDGSPGTELRRYGFPGFGERLLTHSLEFAADGTLFAVTNDHYSGTPDLLYAFDDATKLPTSITVDAPDHVPARGTVHVSGTLDGGPGTATVLSLRRTDRSGTHDMGTVPVAADGTFSFQHKSAVPGEVSYTLTWAGDDERGTSTTTFTVFVAPLPFDVDGDGYAEVVAGSPGEDLDGAADSGLFHVLPGGASGVTGAGSTAYDQSDLEYPHENNPGDLLGRTSASGDFNRDGYADVVVGVPGKDHVQPESGGLLVCYGSASGLSPEGSYGMSPGYWDVSYGRALAVGDFNGDSYDDLAVGQPDQYGGSVWIHFGSAGRLRNIDYGVDYVAVYQGGEGVPGSSDDGDAFGYSLAAGDVDGDGMAELAVGAVGDTEDTGTPTGSVTLLRGSPTGPSTADARRITKNTPGVPGSAKPSDPAAGDEPDALGTDLELADFNGDGRADLAVSAPGAPVRGHQDAGTVTVLYANANGIGTNGAREVTQATDGVPGAPSADDRFGGTITAGDTDRDGRAELAVHSPGDAHVTVIPGGRRGLAFAGSRVWTQDTPGIPDTGEPGDLWGGSLRFADVKGDGYLALIVGAEGENDGRGAVTVIYAGPRGLTAYGSTYLDQDSTDVPDTSEEGDHFGVFR